MRVMRFCWVQLAILLLCGCKSTRTLPHGNTGIKAEQGSSFYVVTPADGRYDTRVYESSGDCVAAALESALAKYAGAVTVGAPVASPSEAADQARLKHADYVVFPRITRWVDRATEWSGKPDRIEITVKVFRASDGANVGGATIVGRSTWFTFGGDHPQDLVQPPMDQFAKSLFDSESRSDHDEPRS